MSLSMEVLTSNLSTTADHDNDLLQVIRHTVQCHPCAQLYTIIMFLSSILGNSANLFVMTRRQIKSPVYTYLRALAISDLLVTFCTIPKFIIICYVEDVCHIEMIMRIFITSMLNAFIGCSNLTTLGVTIERFLAVCFPFQWKVHRIKTAKAAILFITIAWILSFLFYVPNMIVMYYQQNSTSSKCVSDVNLSSTTKYRVYKWIREILFRISPVVWMVLFNTCMLYSVKRNFINSTNSLNIKHPSQQKLLVDKKLTLLVALLAVMYIICIFPEALVFVMNDYLVDLSPVLFYYLVSVMDLTEMFNYSMTFFIYLFFHREFRQALFNLKAYNEPRKVSFVSDYGNRTTGTASQRDSIQSFNLSSTNTMSVTL